jgi:2-oxoglutarate dehydrogenase E1 component
MDDQAIKDSIGALMLIRLYRVRGHLTANLDPLALGHKKEISELHPQTFGFGSEDWDRPIFLNGVLGYERASLREIVSKLQAIYCGSMGAEFMHIVDPDQKQWIQEHLENPSLFKEFHKEDREKILKNLINAESFEDFLNTKHKGAKRFGLEGCEALIPSLLEAIEVSAKNGVKDVVLGMAHRGRLNVLANVMGKPLEQIFYGFTKSYQYCSSVEGSGDVKYHLGYSGTLTVGDQKVTLSLTPNPSHLEAVDAVVLGRVRAKQDLLKDSNRSKVMGILMHGDASFPGQGIVSECFGLSELDGYKTGGTFHIVVNNQIGFTTSPHDSRSTAYSSDFAKAIGAPIFHVNGDDVEAVVFATRLAAAFRHTFQKDVVIDLIGYRRFGHNETDDPSFTQPVMYEKITNHPSVRIFYEKHLMEKGLVEKNYADHVAVLRKETLEKAYAKAQAHDPLNPDWMGGRWASYKVGSLGTVKSTLSVKTLKDLLKKLIQTPPKDFFLHKRMARVLEAKQLMVESGEGIDWATAESLAFASILEAGHPIRLSGQDSGRGTFSQRHAIWTDQKTEDLYVPLNHLGSSQAFIEILNSPLSEVSVLGYEYGYTLSSPETLVLWEAQFGDFANGAQVIVDQFISSGESKWYRLSGLVMLLPHGYEGQGPEHSSARLERYLQLCAENNMHVAYCSTPANYYHILRRQILGSFRKPLILMTPKSCR